jgi:hypothetical protein
MNFPFGNFKASPSCRTPASTNYSHIFKPHELCSYCSNPYRQVENCQSFGQFSNFSYKQMNTNFSNLGFKLNSNFYNPDWSNHSDFSWQAHATRNCTPQVDELHNHEYPQFDNQFSTPSLCNYPPQQS